MGAASWRTCGARSERGQLLVMRSSPVTWVGVAGFEPAASSSRTEHSARQVSWSAAFRHVRGIHAGPDGCP
jgi:hypothetical protein